MQFAEAFKSLGYELKSPRQDWSAQKEDGVCISLWQVEIENAVSQRAFDSKVDAGPLELWATKPGNVKRKIHFEICKAQFDGWLDVVIVTGTPGQAYKSANPWKVAERHNHKWRLVHFENQTGHFKVELQGRQT